MRRILAILAVAAVVAVAFLLLRGASGSANEDKQVRATLAGFSRAGAEKDYTTICQRYLAQHLLDQLRQIKLPCRTAFARSTLATTQAPTVVVKSIKVNGTTALAAVHTAAANQAPLDTTMELVKEGGLWRILSLASPKTTP